MVFSSTSILASCVPNESNLAWREARDSSMAMLLAGGVVGEASGEGAFLLVLLFGIDETAKCKHGTADGVEQLSCMASCRGRQAGGGREGAGGLESLSTISNA
jgi:hypothetical protein